MELNYKKDAEKPLAGWVCAAIGVGFVMFLAGAIIGVRLLGGG